MDRPREERPPPSSDEVLRSLADPGRLAVAGLLARGPRTLSELVRDLRLSPQRVRRHVARLTAAGVVEVPPDRRTYRLLVVQLQAAARESGPSRDPGVALGAVFEEAERVLRQYFRGGRLREVPAKRSKRLIVLERLALEFDAGVRYPEREVNDALKRFHDDYVTLRRHLVDEGFLSRHRGEYWRSGGPVDV